MECIHLQLKEVLLTLFSEFPVDIMMKPSVKDGESNFALGFSRQKQPRAEQPKKKYELRSVKLPTITDAVLARTMSSEHSRKTPPTMKEIVRLPEDSRLRKVFVNFLDECLALENYLFFMDAEKYKEIQSVEERRRFIEYLKTTYFQDGAVHEMHVPSYRLQELEEVNFRMLSSQNHNIYTNSSESLLPHPQIKYNTHTHPPLHFHSH